MTRGNESNVGKTFLVDFVCPQHGQQSASEVKADRLFRLPGCKVWLHDDDGSSFACDSPLRVRIAGEVEPAAEMRAVPMDASLRERYQTDATFHAQVYVAAEAMHRASGFDPDWTAWPCDACLSRACLALDAVERAAASGEAT